MCIAYLTFNRRRAAALAAGPTDATIEAELKRLKADDSEVADAFACLDKVHYTQLDRLRAAAYRGGDAEAIAYMAEVRRFLDTTLWPRAIEAAREEQLRSWNDADEAMAERELQ